MPSPSQLPAAIQAVSGADILVLEQTATGGSSPGSSTVVQASVSSVLTAGGVALTSLPAASPAAAPDEFIALQSGGAALQTNSGLWSYIAAQIPGLRQPVVLLTGNTVLDGSVHNGAILVCEAAITISPAADFSSLSSGFYCTIVNMSGSAVTFASSIVTTGGSTLAAGSAATVAAFSYSGGNVVFANLGGTGGSSVATPGLTIGVSSSSVTTGGSISVVGQVVPGATAVQVSLGTSATVAPSSGWASATVSGTAVTASIAATTAGTFYVWARETANTSTTAVSGAVTVGAATSGVTITTAPTTGTTGSAISFSGSVGISGAAVEVALSTSGTVAPTTGFTNATVSGTEWSASLTPGTAGTYYLWAILTNSTGTTAVSQEITISAPSAYLAIQSQSGGITWSNPEQQIATTQSIATVTTTPISLTMPFTPAQASGATVTGYWTSTAPTSEPTSGVIVTGGSSIAPLFYQTNIAAYLPPPASPGVWYLSMWIDNNGSNNGHVVMQPITWTA